MVFLIVASGCDGVVYSVDDGHVSSGDGSVDIHGSGDGRAVMLIVVVCRL